MLVNFEVASSSILGENCEKNRYGEGGCGGGKVNAICSRQEVADDVISGPDVRSFGVFLKFVGYG